MKWKKILLIMTAGGIFFGGIGGYFVVQNRETLLSNMYMNNAKKAEQESRLLKAAYLYEQAKLSNPKNAKAQLSYAKLNVQLGNYAKAEQELLQCVQISSCAVEGYVALSDLYIRQGKMDDAVSLLNNIPNEMVRAKVGAIRPTAPQFSPAPGRYSNETEVSISPDQDTVCYYTVDGKSLADSGEIWQENILMKTGTTTIKAVAVSPNGLVSDVAQVSYNVDDVNAAVNFKDKTIEAMVRAKLSRYSGHITTGELKTITSLTNKQSDGKKIGGEIQTFSDLQYLKNVTELTLADLSVLPDLTGISVLTGLKSLSLTNCGINDSQVGHLSSIKSLKVLNLSDNSLKNLSALTELSQIEYLSLKNNFIGDVTPLLTFECILYLDLSGNPLGNITALGLLGEVQALSLAECNLADIDALSGLTALNYLDISNNRISDIEVLSKCMSLESLMAGNNQISGITALSGLPRISVLDLRGNDIISLRPLSTLENLKTLNISQNNVSDLSPLTNCEQLQTVFAEGNPLIQGTIAVFQNVQVHVGDDEE